MKRTLIMLISFGLLAASLGTAEAGKSARVERTVQGSYGAYPTPVTGCNSALGPWSCLTVRTRSTEAFLIAHAADIHGQPVLVHVTVDTPSLARHIASFCGKTSRPIAFPPGLTVSFEVALGRGRVPLPCPHGVIKTTGTITVTLSNRP